MSVLFSVWRSQDEVPYFVYAENIEEVPGKLRKKLGGACNIKKIERVCWVEDIVDYESISELINENK